jgi:DNA-binding NarL/FixJ family response regulator
MSTPSASILASAAPGPLSSLAIVADRRLTVAALETLILRDASYRPVQRARGIEAVREALLGAAPSIVVAEGGWSTWRRSLDPSAWSGRILLLLDPEDDLLEFRQAVRARAHGYLSSTASWEGFATALEHLRQGRYYLDPLLVERMLRASRDLPSATRVAGGELSPREADILVRIASGRSSKEIAYEYAITAKTVGNHVHNIYRKLNLRHRGELVLYAVQEGLAGVEATAAG